MSLFSRIPVNKKAVEAAIERLEQKTSAELRVYIERNLPKTNDNSPLNTRGQEQAFRIFYQLEMDKTEQSNAVLIYLAYKDQYCQVIGDKGIHQYVDGQFWRQICDEMIMRFKQQQYTQGVIAAIEKVGEELIVHFPIRPNDRNELPNEVIIRE